MDGGNWDNDCRSPKPYSDLPQGDRTFYVEATDGAGNSGEDSYDWRIEVGPNERPVCQRYDTPITRPGPAGAITFTLPCTDPDGGPSSLRYQIHGFPYVYPFIAGELSGSYETTGEVTFTPDPLFTSGDVWFTFAAWDGVEWSNTEGMFILVAPYTGVRPITTLNLPPSRPHTSGPQNLTNERVIVISFQNDQSPVSSVCGIDLNDWDPATSTEYRRCGQGVNVPVGAPNWKVDWIREGSGPPVEGPHKFCAYSSNQNGTGDPACYEWIIDRTAPTVEITSGPPNPSDSDEATFEFRHVNNEPGDVSFKCRIDGTERDFRDCNSGDTFNVVESGEHTFYVKATDEVGNSSDPNAGNPSDPTTSPYTWTANTATSGPVDPDCDGVPYGNDFAIHDFTANTPDSSWGSGEPRWYYFWSHGWSRISVGAQVCGTELEAPNQGTGTLVDHVDIEEGRNAFTYYTTNLDDTQRIPLGSYAGKLRVRVATHDASGNPMIVGTSATLWVDPLQHRQLGSTDPVRDACNWEAENQANGGNPIPGRWSRIKACFIARSDPGSLIQWHSRVWATVTGPTGYDQMHHNYLTLGKIRNTGLGIDAGLTKIQEFTICGRAGEVGGSECGERGDGMHLHRNGDPSFPSCSNGMGIYEITATNKNGTVTPASGDSPASYCVEWQDPSGSRGGSGDDKGDKGDGDKKPVPPKRKGDKSSGDETAPPKGNKKKG